MNAKATDAASDAGPAKVRFTQGFAQRYTGGCREFEIEAKNMRAVLKSMDAQFPGLGRVLEEETTVAIDGNIHDEPGYFQLVPPGAEVYFIPKLEGG